MQNARLHRDGDVVLRDGSTVRIRVMQPADEAGLCALLTSLSQESRWLRFYCLQNSSAIAAEAHREANLDQNALSEEQVRKGGLPPLIAVSERRPPFLTC